MNSTMGKQQTLLEDHDDDLDFSFGSVCLDNNRCLPEDDIDDKLMLREICFVDQQNCSTNSDVLMLEPSALEIVHSPSEHHNFNQLHDQDSEIHHRNDDIVDHPVDDRMAYVIRSFDDNDDDSSSVDYDVSDYDDDNELSDPNDYEYEGEDDEDLYRMFTLVRCSLSRF